MTTPGDYVARTRDGSVLILELNRPDEMNPMSKEMNDELHEALAAADLDDEVRAIVLTGAGKAFCAGRNLGSGAGRERPKGTNDVLHQHWRMDFSTPRKLLSIMEMETPVICAVNGWALGAGFWYTLACDITIAGESAVFGQPEVRHASQTSFLFPALVGWKNAHRYALTGDHFDAAEALRIGVVNEVVPDDQLRAHAVALAQRLALLPRSAVRTNKAITNQGLQAMGLGGAMIVNSAVGVIAHASRYGDPDLEHMYEARNAGGVREFLKRRDGKFLPEPFGPRSKPREP